MPIACSNRLREFLGALGQHRYRGIVAITLNNNLYLFDCYLWVLWCLRCSLSVRGSCCHKIIARLRSRKYWGGCLCSSQRLSGNDLLWKYLGLRRCYARLLLYHEHGWRLRHLVVIWPSGFASFALRWPLVVISVVGIVCRDSVRASTCTASCPLLLWFWSLWTSLDVGLRLLLAISIICLWSKVFDSLLWYGTLWCCFLIFLSLS